MSIGFRAAMAACALWVVTVNAAGETPASNPSSSQHLLESPRATVTVEDIERYIAENLPEDPAQRQIILNRPGIFREMAQNLYIMRSLAKEAQSSPGFDEAQARWAAQMAYERRLVEGYRTRFVRRELANADWDSMAREAYAAEQERYQRPERVSAAHILIKTEERSEEEALALAEELHGRLVAGEDFSELAQEYSDDEGSAKGGGELGFFQRGKMVPSFEEAAFALEQPGDISDPVQSRFGYHIIVLRERQPAGPIPFEEVKPRIIESLQTKMGGQVWQDKIVALRSAQDVQLDQELLEKLREQYSVEIGANQKQ